jgi:hypothetical protein
MTDEGVAGAARARYGERMRRHVTAWLLLGLVVGLVPLAYASPIDPSAPGGFYDNGDFDDVILHLTSRSSVVEAAPLYVVSVVGNVVGTIGQAQVQPLASTALDPASARPPPSV